MNYDPQNNSVVIIDHCLIWESSYKCSSAAEVNKYTDTPCWTWYRA